MRYYRRIGILLIELLIEAVLLSILMTALTARGKDLLPFLFGAIMALPFMLGLSGYYISRILAAFAWACQARWIYSLLAASAFTAHTLLLIMAMKHQVTPEARGAMLPFLVIGVGIVLVCSYFGNRLSSKWSQTRPLEPLSQS